MIVVIVAGGSGTRLWPLSTATKPKHLLRLTGEKSLLQSSYERASKLTDDIYVLTDESHNDLVAEQLPELGEDKIIVEPGRRGTANCIVLALAKISKMHNPSETITFFHADHHIQDVKAFVGAVKQATRSAEEHDSIALIGIKPEHPATGFGYIEVGEQAGDAFWVDSFKEKPSQEVANKYFESGKYLWNLGLFTAKISTFLASLQNHAPDLAKSFDIISENIDDGAKLKAKYANFENQAIDIALIERTPHIVVVPGNFDWVDIGSYKDLHRLLDNDSLKNTVMGDDKLVYLEKTESSLVMPYNKPIAVIGLKDVVVIDTEEGILVCHKDHAQSVKNAAKKFDN